MRAIFIVATALVVLFLISSCDHRSATYASVRSPLPRVEVTRGAVCESRSTPGPRTCRRCLVTFRGDTATQCGEPHQHHSADRHPGSIVVFARDDEGSSLRRHSIASRRLHG